MEGRSKDFGCTVTWNDIQTDSVFHYYYFLQEVEPMYVECDHMHITALTTALGVGVRVQYMDRAEGGQVNQHDFPGGVPARIHILYRPGHYDVLYQ